ncbi:hypothetical protein [Sinomonas gamaensis]|uniref:hypothetical protein n=1 Tax=Sinomonas gamaensis TaxID=2565624 RepID=UPI001108D015|nr:hypothetical protein [Sinomonas gamaensis]
MTENYSGPWPSQVPTGTFPGMPQTGFQRPRTVTAAFWCLVASAVLPLILVPYQIQVFTDTFTAVMAEYTVQSRRPIPPGLLDQIMNIAVPSFWVGALLAAAVGVLMALGIRAGRNWVRILQTVFAALSLLSVLLGAVLILGLGTQMVGELARSFPVYIVSAATTTAYIVATVLEWLPPSNAYFSLAKAARGGYVR